MKGFLSLRLSSWTWNTQSLHGRTGFFTGFMEEVLIRIQEGLMATSRCWIEPRPTTEPRQLEHAICVFRVVAYELQVGLGFVTGSR